MKRVGVAELNEQPVIVPVGHRADVRIRPAVFVRSAPPRTAGARRSTCRLVVDRLRLREERGDRFAPWQACRPNTGRDQHADAGAPARGPERGTARGGQGDERAARDHRRRRVRQDAGDQPSGGVRHRDGRRAGRTRSCSSRSRRRRRREMVGADGGARAPRASPHARSTPRRWPSCGTSGRPGTAASRAAGSSRCSELLVPLVAAAARHYRSRPAQGPRRRDRVGEGPADLAERWLAQGGDRARRSRPTCSPASTRTTSAPRREPACIDFEDMLVETVGPARDRRRRPRRSSARARRGSASTSTRTRTRSRSACWSCGSAIRATSPSSATRTRRSTRSPARRRTSCSSFEAAAPGARRVVALATTTDRRRRSSPSPTASSAPGPRGALRATQPRAPRPRSGASATTRSERPRSCSGSAPARRGRRGARDRDPRPRSTPSCRELEEALTRAGHPVPRARPALLRPARGSRGAAAPRGRRPATAGPGPRARRRDPDALRAAARARARPARAGTRHGSERRRWSCCCGSSWTWPGRGRGVTIDDVMAELDRRDAAEAAGSEAGVNLLTYHRAKGLEWDAVFLPALEEGLLPIRQAEGDRRDRRGAPAAVRRRSPARAAISRCRGPRGGPHAGAKDGARKPSRFLDALERHGRRPAGARRPGRVAGAWRAGSPRSSRSRAPTAPTSTRPCSRRSSAGAAIARGRTAFPRTSWRTTRCSSRSPRLAHRATAPSRREGHRPRQARSLRRGHPGIVNEALSARPTFRNADARRAWGRPSGRRRRSAAGRESAPPHPWAERSASSAASAARRGTVERRSAPALGEKPYVATRRLEVPRICAWCGARGGHTLHRRGSNLPSS